MSRRPAAYPARDAYRAGDDSPRSPRLSCRRAHSNSPDLRPGLGRQRLGGQRLGGRRELARAGFTLVELLVVILIIGILAALAMTGLFASQEAARRSRTEGFIGQLNNQMTYRWETYRTRRLPVKPEYSSPAPVNLQEHAARQLIARRQLMRIEIPDRWWDVAFDDNTWMPVVVPAADQLTATVDAAFAAPATIYNGSEGPVSDGGGGWLLRNLTNWPAVDRVGVNYIYRTSLSYAYRRRYEQAYLNHGTVPSRSFQGAECLYMILTTGMGDETSDGSLFNQRDFADTDDDGMPEFIDGWGRPIGFLRWAPGFRSDMQTGDPVNDHDPFDPRKVDTLAYRVFPLIYSAGPDGAYGDDAGGTSPFGIEGHSGPVDPSSTFVNLNDPYAPAPDGSGDPIFRGTPLEEHAGIGPSDNIFNQALGIR